MHPHIRPSNTHICLALVLYMCLCDLIRPTYSTQPSLSALTLSPSFHALSPPPALIMLIILSVWKQKGLIGYCFKYIDKPFCLRANDMQVCYSKVLMDDLLCLCQTRLTICFFIIPVSDKYQSTIVQLYNNQCQT